MEKEPQPDSMATVTIKPDYPPSEVYSSEPPPAYHRSQSSAVQVAKIIAVTVVLMSVVLGSFLLACAYVTANASCKQLEQELELLSEAADRFQQPPLQPEALIQEPQHLKQSVPAQEQNTNEIVDNNISKSDDTQSSDTAATNESTEDKEPTTINFQLPLQLDFDDLAGALIEKNQKSRMNCVVEKKRAEQLVDHQPKTVKLPFGLNLTTDPRLERITGERMAIFCESGSAQQQPTSTENNSDSDDSDENDDETIMIQPVMIPIPPNPYQTHMAQQMHPMQSQYQPMEAMRPPMPPSTAQQQNEMPPASVLHLIAQQIITQKLMEAQKAREETESAPRPPQAMFSQRIPIPEEILTRLNRLPNRDVIVAVSEQEPKEVLQEKNENHITQNIRMVPQNFVQQQQRENAQEMNGRQTYTRALPVHIPFHMIQQQQEAEQPEPQTSVADEKPRPHFVQPRSVRSVDALIPKSQKRVKRCSCNCAC